MDTASLSYINEFFHVNLEIKPDFIYPGTMFDPACRAENDMPTPLTSKTKPNYDTPGAYAFFEPCNQNNNVEVMYVGRSNTLRNRITCHWGNYYRDHRNIIDQWHEYCWDNDFPYCPHVAVFVSHGDLRDLEHWLMQLKPRFNIH